MGNFCMGDKGRNEIADRKHEKLPKGPHFRPRARRARGRKWGPAGGFSCFRSVIPFLPKSPMQKLHFIICISGNNNSWKKNFKNFFWTSWSEISLRTSPQNHFRPALVFLFKKKSFGGSQDRTTDLMTCSLMLYHWATTDGYKLSRKFLYK